ncbi:uncharacterized protein LOC130552582 [Triplophysa rosa]|uniref:uncharacterized protein LOC130552582 n=1 Tax=Triplophysa rosa TaxID=992332 RepID=UPI0025461E5C|nr:uncharacterized protein LOC130552582 [Triplophysa rosa]
MRQTMSGVLANALTGQEVNELILEYRPGVPQSECPLCHSDITNFKQHLRVFHGVQNLQERQLWQKLAWGRVFLGGQTCPLCNFFYKQLEKHLNTGHRDISSNKKKNIIKKMEREVTVRKLRELEASNPAIPMVTLTDEPQGNSGNPIAPETLTPSFNTHPSSPAVPATPSFSPSLTPEPARPSISPPGSALPAMPATPSFKPSPPPIFPPSPDATVYGGGLFSPLLFSEQELDMLENLDIPTISHQEEEAIHGTECHDIMDLGFSILMDL